MIEQRPPQNDAEKAPQDVRITATKTIWGYMPGMLAICIPLCALSHLGPAIAAGVLATASISTVGVWLRGGNNAAALPSGNAALDAASKKQIQELEDRLAALESITNFEHHLLEKKYPNTAPISAPPVAPAPTAPVFSLETPGGVMADAPNPVASPSAAAQPFAQSG